MKTHLLNLLTNPKHAQSLIEHGLGTIQKRHTCAHRVSELLEIFSELGADASNVTVRPLVERLEGATA